MLNQSDNDLVVFLSSGGAGCSLDSSPKKNWVEKDGGLPDYICRIAKAVMKTGKPKSMAIAIAVSRTKMWAAGGSKVDAKTRAKAAAAVSAWEALKGRAKAGKVVKASREDNSEYLITLSDTSFNVDAVRQAWSAQTSAARATARAAIKAAGGDPYDSDPEMPPYSYIREMWNDHVIVELDRANGQQRLASVTYSVDNGVVTFGTPVEVKTTYVPVSTDDFSDNEKALLSDVLSAKTADHRLTDLMELAARLR
jgi:hypothetical protein